LTGKKLYKFEKQRVFFLALIILFYTTTNVNSQLRLSDSGQVGIGTTNPKEILQIGDRWTFNNTGTKSISYNADWNNAWYKMVTDESSSIQFDAWGNIYFRMASYGVTNSSFSWSNAIKVQNDLKTWFFNNVGIKTSPSSTYPLYVYGNALADDWLEYSDFRKKENIKEISNMTNLLKNLRGVSYTLKYESQIDSESDSSIIQTYKNDSLENRIHFGFIAQEVQQVFPDMVIEDEHGYLALSINSFIPLLVEAFKDQQVQIDLLKEEIYELRVKDNLKSIATSNYDKHVLSEAQLYQNKPNPFSEKTLIKYIIPDTYSAALINLYDLRGKQLSSYVIHEGGEGEIEIPGSNHKPGIYLYSLLIDGLITEVS
jgi:hypothetical protein